MPWQYYQGAFDVSEQWQVIRLPLDSFKPSGSWLRKTACQSLFEVLGLSLMVETMRLTFK